MRYRRRLQEWSAKLRTDAISCRGAEQRSTVVLRQQGRNLQGTSQVGSGGSCRAAWAFPRSMPCQSLLPGMSRADVLSNAANEITLLPVSHSLRTSLDANAR